MALLLPTAPASAAGAKRASCVGKGGATLLEAGANMADNKNGLKGPDVNSVLERMSEEDKALLERDGVPGASAGQEGAEAPGRSEVVRKGQPEAPQASSGDLPPWAIVPDGFRPPKNRQVAFIMLKGKWTDDPDQGDGQVIVWNMSGNDERLALKRTAGDGALTLAEYTKQMIRYIDGQPVDWEKGAHANIHKFWEDIGHPCRQLLMNWHIRTHTLSDEDTLSFFADCVAVRTASLSRRGNATTLTRESSLKR
jgi:hypothetical protein